MVAQATKERKDTQKGGIATAARWKRYLAVWGRWGLTQVEFCRREVPSVFSMSWWKWNLFRQCRRSGFVSSPRVGSRLLTDDRA